MRVLVCCEQSGIVRDEFLRRGHDAYSCDIRPSNNASRHYQCDAMDVIGQGWDLMIAHPPCRYLSYAGMGHWNKPGRAEKRKKAMAFFMALYNAPIAKVCIENPRGLPCQEFRQPDQVVHPYFFGDSYMKRTCLWLRGLQPLLWFTDLNIFNYPIAAPKPEPVYVDRTGKKRHWTDSQRTWQDRSVTSVYLARAMADQWG